MAEFCDDSFVVVTDDGGELRRYTLAELLPSAMKRGTLQDR